MMAEALGICRAGVTGIAEIAGMLRTTEKSELKKSLFVGASFLYASRAGTSQRVCQEALAKQEFVISLPWSLPER